MAKFCAIWNRFYAFSNPTGLYGVIVLDPSAYMSQDTLKAPTKASMARRAAKQSTSWFSDRGVLGSNPTDIGHLLILYSGVSLGTLPGYCTCWVLNIKVKGKRNDEKFTKNIYFINVNQMEDGNVGL